MLTEQIAAIKNSVGHIHFFSQENLLMMLDITIIIAVCLILVKITNKIVAKVFGKILKRTEDVNSQKNIKTVRLLLLSTINTILIGFSALHILNRLGIDIKPILATAGVLGIAVGFGAQKLIEDLISGILLVIEGQIRAGDVVKIQNTMGVVEKINLRLVVLRDAEGALHFYRNGSISDLTNYTKDYSYALFETSVAYKENVSDVIEVIKKLFEEFKNNSEYGKSILAPVEIFGLDRFDDSAVVITYRIKTLPAKQWDVKKAFNLELKRKFDELGIEIPFPQITVNQP